MVVFTDNGSKDLILEQEIIRIKEEKMIEVVIAHPRLLSHFLERKLIVTNPPCCHILDFFFEVFIVLTPIFEGWLNGPSLPAFHRMGKVGQNQL